MGGSSRGAPRQGADARLRLQLIELHGHRGARGLAPENTIGGFATALAIGVDALELDVGLTADGIVVVTHDPALNPAITRIDGHWLAQAGPAIRTLRRDRLRPYDVGRIRPDTRYAAEFPEQVPQDGAAIPTLAEVFALDPTIRLNIEMKTDPDNPELTPPGALLAEAVAACVHAAGAAARTIVQSFDWSGLRHLQRDHASIALSWLTGDATPAARSRWWGFAGAAPPSAPAAVAAAGGATWAPSHADLTEDLFEEARRLGLRVLSWTVNRPADMDRLIAWGIDGLITDRPDLARLALARAGARLPPLRPRPV